MSEIATPNRKTKEMTNKLVKILEKADNYYHEALQYFDRYNKATDEEMKNIYWTRSEELSGYADGLCKAYEILTGRKIYQHQAKAELMALV